MRLPRHRVVRAAAVCCVLAIGSMIGLASAASSAQDIDTSRVAVGSLTPGAPARSTALPLRADLLGASWDGPADAVELRARTRGGRWSRWVELHADSDGPDRGSAEQRRSARSTTTRTSTSRPMWVGAADQVQLRAHEGQRASRVLVWAINATSTASVAERSTTSLRGRVDWVLGATAAAQPLAPGIRSRAQWKAATPTNTPALAEGVAGVVIHHTAGTNRYSCEQVPALLRGIQRYHMRANGWNDIGYNYLIDRCGGVWEGRSGGLTKPVIGAHTAGFNTATSGIALIGMHASARPSAAARSSLRRLVAWRLDVAHVKPTGSMVLTARTGDKFASGSRVVVRAVSGHRDLFPTSCPGALAYPQLTQLAREAWATGGAKVANITTTYTSRSPDDPLDPSVASISARAVASHADMRVTLRLERISTGELLHGSTTAGTLAQTTWEAPAGMQVASWDVRLVVAATRESGQRARGAVRPVQVVAEDPGFVVTTPPSTTLGNDGDPTDDALALQYTLALDYRVGAWLHDPATGDRLYVLREPDYVGPASTPADLQLPVAAGIPNGTYELRVGLPADPAAGRSIRRFPLTITR